MSKLNFKTPEPLNFDEAGKDWPLWKQKFKIFLVASGKNNEEEKVKISLFLSFIGEKGIEVYNTLFETIFDPDSDEDFHDAEETEEEENKITLKLVLAKFEEYCLPKKNVLMESYKFNLIAQKENQPFTEYLTELRTQIKYCEYNCTKCNEPFTDRMLRERVILGLFDKKLQIKLLEDKKLTLSDIINKCKVAEAVVVNKKLLSQVEKVNMVDTSQKDVNLVQKKTFQRHPNTPKCDRCGGFSTGQHLKYCPAQKEGAKCNLCGKPGHFARVCRSRQQEERPKGSNQLQLYRGPRQSRVNELRYGFSSDEGNRLCQNNNIIIKKYVFRINTSARGWFKVLNVGGAEVEFKLDTGADISCLPIKYIKQANIQNQIQESNNQLFAYNNCKIETFGKINLICIDCDTQLKKIVSFEIVGDEFQPILSRDACVELNLLNRTNIFHISMDSKEKFIEQNLDVFDGIGTIPGECSIMLKENSVPTLKYKKRIPESLHKRLKITLKEMQEQGIITSVDYPTDWVNNLEIVEKPNGSLRICLDPIPLNKCIRREHFLIPTVEEIISRLSNKSFFTVLDLKQGFWQLSLDKKSSELTTFMTPFGRYRWNRVPFGISSAPEMFMKKMVAIFGNISNVEVYFDDIFITGSTKKEHDETLEMVLSKARENGIKFNKEKVQLCKKRVKFMGQIIQENRVEPDPKYIEAIKNISQPQNKKDILRILGMFKYLARFIPNLTKKSANLRNLTRLDTEWKWLDAHQREFEDLKEILCKGTSLRIFDPKLPLIMQTDASKDGLGCVLMQNDQPIAFASRSLTITEQKWSTMEKELLAIVFACEKFHHFIYGREVIVQSDHKPLEQLIRKELDDVTVRLQRMFLMLLRYPGLEIKYTPGSKVVIADCLSRAPLKETGSENEELKYVIHLLKRKVCLSENNYKIYVEATKNDSELVEIIDYVKTEWPEYKKLSHIGKRFHKLKDQLRFEEELLFLNDKLIIPHSLRVSLLKILHEPHLGIEKTLARARNMFYWTGITDDVKTMVKNCRICEKYTRNNCSEPLIQEENPQYPWQKTSMDIYEYAGKFYIAFVDAYSGWICTERLKDKSITSVIAFLENIFNHFGSPTEIRTDNSPFNSKQLLQYADINNIKMKFSSPNYPQSNGLAEKAVGIAKLIIKKAIDEGKGNEIGYRILEYNTTPIASMSISPTELFMGRMIKTKLPVNMKNLVRTFVAEEEIQKKITEKKIKQKEYFDRHTKKLSRLEVGDKVMFKKDSTNWAYGEVIEQLNERSYNIKSSSGTIFRRNRKFIVKTNNTNVTDVDEYDFLDDGLFVEDNNEQVTHVESPNIEQSNIAPTVDVENQPLVDDTENDHVTSQRGRVIRPPNRFGDWEYD